MYEELLPHTLPTEAERLDRMAHAHDPDTYSTIERLNLPANANCLDIGTGRGSVAIWLAETFPAANVTASDLDLTSVRENTLPNLTLKKIDLRRDDLGTGVYDFVHCRAVLCFLPSRIEVLSGIFRSLKPGGVFIATEMDFSRIASGPDRFWAAFWTAYLEFAASQGWDLGFGGTLPRVLARTGFTETDARHIQPILNHSGNTAGSAEAETWSLTLATLAPQLIGQGFMSETLLTEALSIIRNPEAWTAGPGFMVVSARRPSA
ncbi:class I SAM-dependent methyltransferase [Ruegeria sp. Ofav3-42]|uniref:class I SAM-dependent methyltransferase n=1 Tax=Ruegeria sp. Ofav3-42 TaxID=2917759 RepID=UPI001EF51403|nr:class I SAM-dependent methyltransferase [Ruegeria sp. Ofav3-42]MCG7521877.1 class I SAM-dependent methyltransferase [Ruegeria sp. Ofav3-42]